MKFLKQLMEAGRIPDSAKNHTGMIDVVNGRSNNPKAQYVNSGYSAYVDRDNDPHEMDNVNRFAATTDPTSKLHLWLKENRISNPFLPRIITAQKDNNGVVHTKVEQLVSFTSPKVLSIELAQSYSERIFSEVQVNHLNNLLSDKTYRNPMSMWIQQFTSYIDQALDRPNIVASLIIDEQLTAAIKVLNDWRQRYAKSSFVDIHEDNIMWRIGTGGPQLVITDPFAQA